jgi:hypothetical protein
MSDRDREEWTPSKREQQLSWWLPRLMRYGVGGGGIVWAIWTGHTQPVIWAVLGLLAFGAGWSGAKATDYAAALLRAVAQAEEEARQRRLSSGSEDE